MVLYPDIQHPDADALKKAIGEIVTRRRKAAGLEQRAFSRMSGLGNSHVRLIENGEVNISISTLLKIACALGTTPADLIREAQDKLECE